jgi:hypothetical protein
VVVCASWSPNVRQCEIWVIKCTTPTSSHARTTSASAKSRSNHGTSANAILMLARLSGKLEYWMTYTSSTNQAYRTIHFRNFVTILNTNTQHILTGSLQLLDLINENASLTSGNRNGNHNNDKLLAYILSPSSLNYC